ncbi:acyl-CoA thioesterase domain-containing protein [Actinomycetospora chiangmaiensis]|uniref:acyl-CoA thioesterase domain-containing protein n=1 Tax=Actinomycetospora chiangmaiensis TaxID=402650 RepID=UPI00037D1A28|nr:acyl-CoA thioesterase domain-containing protein [Actinomycetospora chiangmaiensis]
MTSHSTAFFRADGDELVPLRRATSGWGGADGPGQVRGTAVSGVLARGAERAAAELEGAERFRPVRWTVDLFRPGGMVPSTVEATVVRGGRRLRLVDVSLVQATGTVARGSLLLLATGGPTSGTTWTAPLPAVPTAPPADLVPDPTEPTLYRADGDWTTDRRQENAARKATWFPAAPIVEGEEPSGFAHLAAIGDAANLTSSWGTLGVEYINADLTLAIARVPAAGDGVGVFAESRVEAGGIALGTVTMFDRHGALGSVTIATLANGAQVVQP